MQGRSADPRDRLPDPRDRLPDPRDRHAEPRERYADPRELPMPPMDSYRDSRDRAASRPDRFADPRADSRGVGRPREQQGLPLPPQDRFAVPKVMSAVVVNGETRVPSQHMVRPAAWQPAVALVNTGLQGAGQVRVQGSCTPSKLCTPYSDSHPCD